MDMAQCYLFAAMEKLLSFHSHLLFLQNHHPIKDLITLSRARDEANNIM